MKLYESLYILKRYSEVIETLMVIMLDNHYHRKKEWNKKDTIHYVTLYQNIIMDVKSFLDEYENWFLPKSEDQYKERILAVKRIAKPAIDQIKKWKEIGAIRNEMIAHNWRDGKTGDIVIAKLGTYDSPRNFHDLLFLQTYVDIVQAVISAEFADETAKVWPYIQSLQTNETQTTEANANFAEEIKTLINEINSNCEIANKDYRVNEGAILSVRR